MALFKSEHHHTHHTEIHEHRAPTDESIRLADEMREKALQSVIDSIKVGDNTFDGQVVQTMNYNFGFDVHAIFKLNGRKYHAKVELDSMLAVTEPDLRKRRLIIAERMAEVIAMELMSALPMDDK